jgi:hypothetical protein
LPELTPDELQAILDKLDAVCEQARELQQQIKITMAEAARRDYPHERRPRAQVSRTPRRKIDRNR